MHKTVVKKKRFKTHDTMKNIDCLKFALKYRCFLVRYTAFLLVRENNMKTYLTIEELASHLKLAVQTIRRWVLNREIPFHKIKKVIRFRLSEIELWIENGAEIPDSEKNLEVDSFAETETERSGEMA